MKLFDIIHEEAESPMDDVKFSDQVSSRQIDAAVIGVNPPFSAKHRGKNGKKADRIVAKAKQGAKDANPADADADVNQGPDQSFTAYRQR